ncbi:hypothetical protein [Paraburkholderia metrosideri]|jgi:hypothetical protein|uniref:Uncharacterized protein n=1 Tax=Paraburkholderia metrosideri TaxID=580937 RepID=A0ABM8P0D3_9BURK|nr:hypothetical protein [Paraburkholderia metrosideri]CAD6552115.1 hypothetical protein LMG28140_05090 [Paraburkholderia metrosideri]
MRPDHTAAEFAQPQTMLATPLDAPNEIAPQKPMRALTRVTFCFAWLFGLEPFLTGSADETLRSSSERSH